MIKVNNRRTIFFLAKRNYLGNKRRNLIIILAVALTAFLITSVCSIGMGYWDAMTKRSLYMAGVKYDIMLPAPTEKQIQKAYQMDKIQWAGLNVKCAVVKNYDGVPTQIRLFWSDKVNWEQQCVPAHEFTAGTYPQAEDEIILSTQMLGELGIENPQIGMKLPMTYYDLSEDSKSDTKVFKLSGYFRDYTSKPRGYISEAFYRKTGVKPTDLSQGYLQIILKNPLYSNKDLRQIGEAFQLETGQVLIADRYLLHDFIRFAVGLGFLFFLILASGYLFIHNVLYISVSRNVRYFGQLKTLGVTPRQIRRYIHMQMLWNSVAGIPIGLLAGAGVSFLIVPAVLNLVNPTLDASHGAEFSPVVYLAAAVFSLLSVWLSSRKPAVLAASISPVEATRYLNCQYKHSQRRRCDGGKALSMARRNVFQDKKKAFIVLSSFFIALTIFLAVNVYISGNNAKSVLNALRQSDLVIKNAKVFATDAVPGQVFDIGKISELEHTNGVARIDTMYAGEIVVPYTENHLEAYFKEACETFYVGTDYKAHLQAYIEDPSDAYYTGRIQAIDENGFDKINQKMGGTLDKSAFTSGEYALLSSFGDISLEACIGKEYSFRLSEEKADVRHKIEIAAQCPYDYVSGGLAGGYAPNLLVSQEYLISLQKDPILELVNVDYDTPFNQEAEQAVRKIFQDTSLFLLESKLDSYDEMKKSEDQIRVLGGCLSLILFVLALMNYFNLTATGIENRRKEFAILEGIGMTRRQQLGVLALEGLYYGLTSLGAVVFLGLPASYFFFQVTSQYGTAFSIPVIPCLLAAIFFLVVCVMIPPSTYRMIHRGSVVEQLTEI